MHHPFGQGIDLSRKRVLLKRSESERPRGEMLLSTHYQTDAGGWGGRLGGRSGEADCELGKNKDLFIFKVQEEKITVSNLLTTPRLESRPKLRGPCWVLSF